MVRKRTALAVALVMASAVHSAAALPAVDRTLPWVDVAQPVAFCDMTTEATWKCYCKTRYRDPQRRRQAAHRCGRLLRG